jgi:hypothetical protein
MKRMFLVCLMLFGCANDANIYGCCIGQRVVGNEVSVQITNVWSQADAFPLAEKHCRQYARAARYNGMSGHNASFDCVKVN